MEELSESLSSIRADIWNDNVVYMIGGETDSQRDTYSDSVKTYDLVNENSDKWTEPTRSESGKGITQCVYNSDTLITIGGAKEEGMGSGRRRLMQGGGGGGGGGGNDGGGNDGGDGSNTYFSNFTILGGIYVAIGTVLFFFE